MPAIGSLPNKTTHIFISSPRPSQWHISQDDCLIPQQLLGSFTELFGLIFQSSRFAGGQIGVNFLHLHWLVHACVLGAFARAMRFPAFVHIIADAAIQSAVFAQYQIHTPVAQYHRVVYVIHHSSIAIFKRPVNLITDKQSSLRCFASLLILFKPLFIRYAGHLHTLYALPDFFNDRKSPLVVINTVIHIGYRLQFVHNQTRHSMEI